MGTGFLGTDVVFPVFIDLFGKAAPPGGFGLIAVTFIGAISLVGKGIIGFGKPDSQTETGQRRPVFLHPGIGADRHCAIGKNDHFRFLADQGHMAQPTQGVDGKDTHRVFVLFGTDAVDFRDQFLKMEAFPL